MKKQLPLLILASLLICLLFESTGALASGCNPNPIYCTPLGNTNLYGNGYVTEFKITDSLSNVLIDKISAYQANCCNYVNNTGAGTPNLTQGATYTFSGSRKDSDFFNEWNYGMNIWIDYNDDGTFTNTGGSVEIVYKEGLSNVQTFSFTYTIPTSGITTGIHRLRIRTHYSDADPDPCANLTSGAQGMDFLVNIVCAHAMSASAGSNTSVCTGTTINLSSGGTGNAPLTYSWCGPNSFTSLQQNPVIASSTVADSGTYVVVVKDSNGCVAKDSMTVAVGGSGSTTASSNSPVCSMSTLNLSSGAGTGYSWTGPNGFTSNQQFPVLSNIAQADSGIYTVTVTEAGGCTATATTTVKVNGLPVAFASATNDSVCYGASVNLSSGGGVSYSWSGPNSFSSSEQNPVIPVAVTADEGSYTVTVTDANGCSDSDSVDVTVYAALTPPTIIQSGDTLIVTDTTYTSYQWYADTVLIPGATHTWLVVTANGNYNIDVSNENGCSVAVGINVNLTEVPIVSEHDFISLSPNPATDKLTIRTSFSSGLQDATLLIINMAGQEVIPSISLTPDLSKGEGDATIYVGNLPSGIYFVELKSDRGTTIKRFVKQ